MERIGKLKLIKYKAFRNILTVILKKMYVDWHQAHKMYVFKMYINAVYVIFSIKLRLSKAKNLYHNFIQFQKSHNCQAKIFVHLDSTVTATTETGSINIPAVSFTDPARRGGSPEKFHGPVRPANQNLYAV